MTNQIAIGIGIVLIVLIGLDLGFQNGDAMLFLARKLLGLLNWIAFWR